MSYSIGMSEVHNKKVTRAIKRKVVRVVSSPIKHTERVAITGEVVSSNKIGRPRKLNSEAIEEICIAFEQFIADNEDPTIPKFTSSNAVAIKYGLFKGDMVDYDVNPEFRVLAKRCIEKQEAHLLTMAKTPILAIFRLKQPQHGYKDKVDVEIDQSVSVKHSVDPAMALDFQEYLKRRTIEE